MPHSADGLSDGALSGVTHRYVDAGGLRMHIAEAGEGPLVLLLHGFPESWYSWRHQLTALAAAGFHAVAPDQRGYCRTGPPGGPGRPARVDDYTILHLTGDVIALMDALGESQAVVAGHDWGAPVAWNTALFRPDRVRGVIGLSVPYRPRGSARPVETLRAFYTDGFYICYFQAPGVADAELSRDRSATFRRLLVAASGDGPMGGTPVVPPGGEFLDLCPEPSALPAWLTADDIEVFAAEYAEPGFTGPLNWYRNLDRSWELTAAWQHAPVTVPALYLAGDRDLVVAFSGGPAMLAQLRDCAPRLREPVLLPGCGHWTQQERPAEVSRAMIGFIQELD
ncbi:MAG TPA: alpha/beta hydrolase [Streptosporangiaceae bacterium]|nr:alpha/beta hydrolase [Streptosporangiaceae bacterium]